MCKLLFFILCICLCCSCQHNENYYTHDIQPTDDFLEYELDSDVKIPLLIRTCTSDRELLYFQNSHWADLLIYDIYNGELIRRNSFDVEGNNAIKGGFLNGFMMRGCDQIFISGLADGHLYETDTTGCIKNVFKFSNYPDGYRPLACFKDNGCMRIADGKLYLPQSIDWKLGEKAVENSSLLCSVDLISGKVERLPVTFPLKLSEQKVKRGTAFSANLEYKCCFDGRFWVYSFAYMDDLMIFDPITFRLEYKSGRSRYIDKVETLFFRSMDDKVIQRIVCESPAYGNILYDDENKVYYRIAFIPQEINKEENVLLLLHNGRKQFSVMIYDQHFNLIGERLFPVYTYNPRLCFVSKGNLYISTNHVMNPDYSDDVLSFQKMELVKLQNE